MLTIENEESHASDIPFEDLFKQYYAYAVKQIIWIVKDQSIAEELAQEVFLQLYRSDWKVIENISGWLIKSSTIYTRCYYTLRNSNKKMMPIKLYKNQKNPKMGNVL